MTEIWNIWIVFDVYDNISAGVTLRRGLGTSLILLKQELQLLSDSRSYPTMAGEQGALKIVSDDQGY